MDTTLQEPQYLYMEEEEVVYYIYNTYRLYAGAFLYVSVNKNYECLYKQQ